MENEDYGISSGGIFTIRELRCSDCKETIKQREESGSFASVSSCPNCKSTRIATIRIYQSVK